MQRTVGTDAVKRRRIVRSFGQPLLQPGGSWDSPPFPVVAPNEPLELVYWPGCAISPCDGVLFSVSDSARAEYLVVERAIAAPLDLPPVARCGGNCYFRLMQCHLDSIAMSHNAMGV
ncbi:hypothetical protein NL676_006981 [Syzygium grande]|nr:hypothetical protein NL676_006981 [Syzygium grande]